MEEQKQTLPKKIRFTQIGRPSVIAQALEDEPGIYRQGGDFFSYDGKKVKHTDMPTISHNYIVAANAGLYRFDTSLGDVIESDPLARLGPNKHYVPLNKEWKNFYFDVEAQGYKKFKAKTPEDTAKFERSCVAQFQDNALLTKAQQITLSNNEVKGLSVDFFEWLFIEKLLGKKLEQCDKRFFAHKQKNGTEVIVGQTDYPTVFVGVEFRSGRTKYTTLGKDNYYELSKDGLFLKIPVIKPWGEPEPVRETYQANFGGFSDNSTGGYAGAGSSTTSNDYSPKTDTQTARNGRETTRTFGNAYRDGLGNYYDELGRRRPSPFN